MVTVEGRSPGELTVQTLNFCILQGHLLLQLGDLSLKEQQRSPGAQRDYQTVMEYLKSFTAQDQWVLEPAGSQEQRCQGWAVGGAYCPPHNRELCPRHSFFLVNLALPTAQAGHLHPPT